VAQDGKGAGRVYELGERTGSAHTLRDRRTGIPQSRKKRRILGLRPPRRVFRSLGHACPHRLGGPPEGKRDPASQSMYVPKSAASRHLRKDFAGGRRRAVYGTSLPRVGSPVRVVGATLTGCVLGPSPGLQSFQLASRIFLLAPLSGDRLSVLPFPSTSRHSTDPTAEINKSPVIQRLNTFRRTYDFDVSKPLPPKYKIISKTPETRLNILRVCRPDSTPKIRTKIGTKIESSANTSITNHTRRTQTLIDTPPNGGVSSTPHQSFGKYFPLLTALCRSTPYRNEHRSTEKQ